MSVLLNRRTLPLVLRETMYDRRRGKQEVQSLHKTISGNSPQAIEKGPQVHELTAIRATLTPAYRMDWQIHINYFNFSSDLKRSFQGSVNWILRAAGAGQNEQMCCLCIKDISNDTSHAYPMSWPV